jgi:hypothetical protein
MQQAGMLTLALDARSQDSEHSTIRVTVNGQPFTVALAGSAVRSYAVGSIAVAAPGYVRVDLQGVSKDGSAFGEVSALKVTTAAPAGVCQRSGELLLVAPWSFGTPELQHAECYRVFL